MFAPVTKTNSSLSVLLCNIQWNADTRKKHAEEEWMKNDEEVDWIYFTQEKNTGERVEKSIKVSETERK